MTNLEQYQIVVVNLDPTVGSEIRKTRPCVIVSPDEMNDVLKTVVIAPITSQTRNYPSRVEFNFEGAQNWIVLDQIRTIDKSRVLKVIDYLPKKSIFQVKNVIKVMFVD
jgi:mRNA interferase MazF